MAQGKKTVLVYTDWGEIFDKLDEVEAGRLVKHFFDYIRDKNPVPVDRITDLSFTPIKNQLKRDLKSWEETSEEKSRGGRLGNLKKYRPDLYKKIVAQKLTLEEAEKLAYAKKNSHTDGSTSESDASTSECVHDTDTEKDKDKEKSNIDIRKLKFADTLKSFLKSPENPNGYTREFLNEFYAYWTEPNMSGSKFRKELERTWDIKRRLATWAKNDKRFVKTGETMPTSMTGPAKQPVDR